jgi:hypothetical protein
MNMKRWIVLTATMATGVAAATNLVSFTNLAGVKFMEVTPVRTNKIEFVFKVRGKPGFQTEKLTNLAPEVRWVFQAQERAAAAQARKEASKEFHQMLRLRTEWVERAQRDWSNAQTTPSNYTAWEYLRGETVLHLEQMEQDRREWSGKATEEDLKLLNEWIEALKTIHAAAVKGYDKAWAAEQEKVTRDRIERAAREAAESEPWVEVSLGTFEKSEIYTTVIEAVKLHLKAPRTAVFDGPKSIEVQKRSGGQMRAVGYVDSQNGFGALIRNTFVAEMRGGKVVSVKFPE